MSVRHGILAVLERRSAHGYELRRELEDELGSHWSLNYGQVYTTLERLVRDGLVVQSGTVAVSDAPDRKLYTVTPAGRAELRRWFLTPVEGSEARRDELFAKIVLALTSEVDVSQIIHAQRKNELRRIAELTSIKEHTDPVLDLAEVLQLDLFILRTEATLRWLEIAESKIGKAADSAPGSVAIRDVRPVEAPLEDELSRGDREDARTRSGEGGR